jgi:hypothetical protein
MKINEKSTNTEKVLVKLNYKIDYLQAFEA